MAAKSPHAVDAGLIYASLAAVIAVTYLLTMPPSWTFEDTPLFTAACSTLGVPHPPGYPLWVLTCAPLVAVTGLLGVEVGVGAGLASIIATTLSCLLLARLLMRVTKHVLVAGTSAAIFGLAATVWSQAIIAEAYALNCLLWLACLNVADDYVRRGSSWRLVFGSLLVGLGLSNHWPLFVLALPSILLWLLPAWGNLWQDFRQRWLICVLAGVLGLLPYVHLFVASEASARFADGIFLDSIWGYVSRQSLGSFDLAAQHPRWNERIAGGGWAVLNILREYAWLGGVVGVIGLWQLRRIIAGWQLAALVWAMLAVTFVLAVYRPFLPQSELSAQTFSNYGLTAYAAFAFGVGVFLANFVRGWSAPMQYCSCVAVVLAILAWHGPKVDRSSDDLSRRHALVVNQALPPGTLMLLGTQNFGFGLHFYKFLEPEHSRVNAIPVTTYLGEYPVVQLYTVLQQRQQQVALAPMLEASFPKSWYGSYGVFNSRGATEFVIDARTRELLRYAAQVRESSNNVFTAHFADRLLFEFAIRMFASEVEDLDADASELLKELATTPAVRFASFLASLPPNATVAQVEPLVAGLGDLSQYQLPWRTDVLHILASAHIREQQFAPAIAILEEALAGFPASTNTRVLFSLLSLQAQTGNFARYAYLRRRYPSFISPNLAGHDSRCAANLGRPCTP